LKKPTRKRAKPSVMSWRLIRGVLPTDPRGTPWVEWVDGSDGCLVR
jgi:hypothetical protein